MATLSPFRINLFDESTVHENCDGEIVEWQWFKNAATTPFSTVQNPTSVAMSGGDTIRLKVKDSCGCSAEIVGEFLAPCVNLSAWLLAHALYIKLEGGSFDNDPGCCGTWWNDPGFVVTKRQDSLLECNDRRAPYNCGGQFTWTDTYIRCVDGYLGCDVRLCGEGNPTGWTLTRTGTFPPFVTLNTWYDFGAVTVTGGSTAPCRPGSGMRLYAKWV